MHLRKASILVNITNETNDSLNATNLYKVACFPALPTQIVQKNHWSVP